jgi:iron complex transport system substrate-binding protein
MSCRRFVASMLVLSGLVAACGDDDATSSTTASTAAVATTATSEDSTTGSVSDSGDASPPDAAGFPVTIEHKYGSTSLEEAPTRVFALGATDHDPLLALGVTPIGVVNWRGPAAHVWNADEFGASAPVAISDPADGIEFEAIAAADPDLTRDGAGRRGCERS